MRTIIMMALASLIGIFPEAQLESLCVDASGASGCFTSIQAAVDAAMPGDRIEIGPGVYPEDVLVETDGLKLRGVGVARDDYRSR